VGEAISDETKIRQIVINLLSNALKHTDEGEVWVRVSRDGSMGLEIAVSDTGTGIPADQFEAIFQEWDDRCVDLGGRRIIKKREDSDGIP
jgi:signal transduction histidine kinase